MEGFRFSWVARLTRNRRGPSRVSGDEATGAVPLRLRIDVRRLTAAGRVGHLEHLRAMEFCAHPAVWNMFKRREEVELWCAVPAESAVPRFLFSGEWDYGGQHPEPRAVPGFQNGLARQSVRMNGFYLFQLLAPPG